VFGLGDCAAETGLNSVIPGFAEAATFHADCYNYAQGGARVTDPVGPGNVNTYPSDPGGALGQLTVPVFTQIQNHLGKTGGKFAADDLVTVLAGGNDVFMNMAVFQAQVGAGMDPTAAATAAATAMGTAGAQLAGYIKAMILANGATRVVVVNLPDVSQTPYALSAEASFPGVSAVINSLVTTFNQQLSDGLKDAGSGVLLVDAYTQGRAQTANPAVYGITNVTTPACDLAKTQAGGVPLATSLVCTSSTLISGDVSHYEYADSVHPTPYGYQLLAQYVIQRMTEAGWL
jgi:phospholipase/lecithinase/hemolysin